MTDSGMRAKPAECVDCGYDELNCRCDDDLELLSDRFGLVLSEGRWHLSTSGIPA